METTNKDKSYRNAKRYAHSVRHLMLNDGLIDIGFGKTFEAIIRLCKEEAERGTKPIYIPAKIAKNFGQLLIDLDWLYDIYEKEILI